MYFSASLSIIRIQKNLHFKFNTMIKTLLNLILFISCSLFSVGQIAITSVSPLSGGAGTSVTISGSGFDATAGNNRVYVGGVAATITSAGTTSLTINIPDAAAGRSKISVINLTTNLSAWSNQDFIRTFTGGVNAATGTMSNQFPTSNAMTGVSISGEGTGMYTGFKFVTGDFDNDGKIDFAQMGTRVSSSMTVFQNNTTAGALLTSSGFSSAATLTLDVNSTTVYPYATDINNDGLLDILISRTNGFTIFVNTSSGVGNFSFSKSTFTPSPTYYCGKSVLADLNKDGLPDIASINPVSSAGVSYFKNTSSGGSINFNVVPVNKTAPQTIGDIVAADLDSDGDNDIIVSSTSGASYQSVYYNLNTNTVPGTLSISNTFTTVYGSLPVGTYSGTPVALAIADFDNDNDMDIASVTKGGSGTPGGWIYIHRNDGSLSFTSFYTGNFTSSSNITYTVRATDLNGDGKAEIALAQQNSGGLYGMLNKYSSGMISGTDFASVTTFSPSNLWESFAVDDFNSDGKVDVIAIQYFSTSIMLFTSSISTYYPKSAGATNLQTLSNWSSKKDGTGTTPADFSTANTFYLTNSSGTTSFAIAGALTVAGKFVIPSGATLSLGANNFSVSGVLSNSGTISNTTGSTIFNGTAAQVAGGTGSYGNLTINNSNGVTLESNTTVNNTLTLTAGNLDIAGHDLTTGNISGGSSTSYVKTSGSGAVKKSVANSSTFNFPVGNTAYNPVSITNNAGADDVFSVRVLDEIYVNGSGGSTVSATRVKRTWDIGKTNPNGGSGVNFVFNWNTGETFGTLVTPALFHYASGWTEQKTGTTSFGSNSLTYSGYTGTFSPFGIAETNSTLPVSWLGFSARDANGIIVLDWSTAAEVNSKNFTVQRSNNGSDWNDIGSIPAAGNSRNINQYSFNDKQPIEGVNYYRLKQTDIDGKQSFSKTIKISLSADHARLSVYPNPVSRGTLNIVLNKTTNVQVFNIAGVQVMQRLLPAGTQQLKVEQLSRGTYYLKAGNLISKFIVQ